MAENTSIEWTHRPGTKPATWNPTTGCDRISAGCDNCYALTLAKRLKAMGSAKYQTDGDPRTSGPGFGVAVHPDTLTEPLRWRGPRTVFVNSMSDLFHARVPREFVAQVFAVMGATPQHTYQILTKRPERMARMLRDECTCHAHGTHFRSAVEWAATPHSPTYVPGLKSGLYHRTGWPLDNVWLGVSVESDGHTGRADHLRATPAAIRFISAEPLLSDLPSLDLTGIDWLITGGESGPGARPAHPDWFRSLRDQCAAAGVAYFHKQSGLHAPVADRPRVGDVWMSTDAAVRPWEPGDGHIRRGCGDFRSPDGETLLRRHSGKHHAGRELDGRTWDEYPRVAEAVAS